MACKTTVCKVTGDRNCPVNSVGKSLSALSISQRVSDCEVGHGESGFRFCVVVAAQPPPLPSQTIFKVSGSQVRLNEDRWVLSTIRHIVGCMIHWLFHRRVPFHNRYTGIPDKTRTSPGQVVFVW